MQVSQHTHIPAEQNKHLVCLSAEEREGETRVVCKGQKKKCLGEKEGGCCSLWLSHVEVD